MDSRRIVLAAALAMACGGRAQPATSPTPTPASEAEQGCARTSIGETPLIDLRAPGYKGESGGLYGDGRNSMPADHLAAGLDIARTVRPMDANGQPDPNGRYAFLSIGMSNTTQEFSAFVPLANNDGTRDPHLVVIDGAQGGVTAADWINPSCDCWTVLANRLRQSGVSSQQVATAWIKLADRQPTTGWPAYARTLAEETVELLRMLRSRFPNLRLAYLTSRIYAGYATSTLNPEPYAYESGFAMRWVIQEQMSGSSRLAFDSGAAPWIAWGPYLWADGLRPRSDGLTWSCSEFQSDGTHPSGPGRQKVADRLLDFVHSDPTAVEWYRR